MKRVEINNSKDLATFLKKRRSEMQITQKSLADFSDLSHNGISRIELNDSDIKLSTLIKFSKYLGFKIKLEVED